MALKWTWMPADQLVKKKIIEFQQLTMLILKMDLELENNSLCIWFKGH